MMPHFSENRSAQSLIGMDNRGVQAQADDDDGVPDLGDLLPPF